jgi:flagellar biosynthesis/type III secretory pathway protein FliH
MSSSDARRPGAPSAARGAVLAPDALAAFGVAGAAAAWRPLDMADALIPSVAHAAADVFGAFDALDVPAAPDVGTNAGFADAGFADAGFADAGFADAGFADAGFADALPDFLTTPDDPDAIGLSPELSLARERAVREELARDFERQLAEAAARHERELAESHAAGVEQGQAEGYGAAERMLAGTMAALEAAREQLAALEDRWLANLDENVAVLAVGVARHLIGREIAADDALVRERVAHALAEFPLEQSLNVRVNPADLATLKAAFGPDRAGPRELRWTADERVARGGCLVEGRERIVDGRVDAALERVYRRLSGQHA